MELMFTIQKDSENSSAMLTVVQDVKPHPNADRLEIITVSGYEVIVAKDAEYRVGEMVVFFEGGTKINPVLLSNLNQYRDVALNADKEAKPGYFEPNNRVKSVSLRGSISQGFVLDPSEVAKAVGLEPEIMIQPSGTQFTHIGDVYICDKYYSGSEKRRRQTPGEPRPKQVAKIKSQTFRHHTKTVNLFRTKLQQEIPDGSFIQISEKIHGTSARAGFHEVSVRRDLTRFQRLWNRFVAFLMAWFGAANVMKLMTQYDLTDKQTRFVSGSRRVNFWSGPEHSGHLPGPRCKFHNEVQLSGLLGIGETVFAEICATTDQGIAVQKAPVPSNEKLLRKNYGKSMNYTYGVEPGDWDFWVYRVSQERGGVIRNFGPRLLDAFCEMRGWKRPHDYGTWYVTWRDSKMQISPVAADGSVLETFQDGIDYIKHIAEGVSPEDPGHIKEGVCIVVLKNGFNESGLYTDDEYRILKYKTPTFCMLEDKSLDAGNIDIESLQEGEE